MSETIDEVAFKKFVSELNEQVATTKEAEESGAGNTEPDVALAKVMIGWLEEEGVVSGVQLCPYEDEIGRKRCAISGYSLSDDEERLDLFLAVHFEMNGDLPTISGADLAQITGRAARFFDYASKKDWTRFQRSPETLEAAERVYAALKQLSNARVFILTNALARDRDVDSLKIAGVSLDFEIVDAARLFRLAGTGTSRSDIEIDFVALTGRPLSCLEMRPRSPEYETYLAIFTGKLLFDLYKRFGQRLFEFNVRSFLQAKGKVNRGIRDSLRDSPDRFMAYNNGLVATADRIEVALSDGETVISKISGLQIVNGAQTTASIYRASKVDKIDLSHVSVAVKITKVDPAKLQEFVPLISRFANTQNVIQVADLSANNEFHVQLEQLSREVWIPGEESRWFYERARGSYEDALQREGSTPAKKRDFKATTPASQRITKTDLARYLMGWMGRPHVVSMGAQKNFAVFMSELPDLFVADWKPDAAFYRRCVAQAIVYRACEKVVRTNKFPAYRANIAAYTYALLAHISAGHLDLDWVWKNQSISPQLSAMLGPWTKRVDEMIRASAGARNITEWCKKAECWNAIQGLNLEMADDLPELSRSRDPDAASADGGPTENNTLALADSEAVEECMRHDAATWAKLNFWGVSTNSLDYYERGVAHTLSEYAALQWNRRPSVKQARIGMRVLRRAREENLV